jgi:hypothetical protein
MNGLLRRYSIHHAYKPPAHPQFVDYRQLQFDYLGPQYCDTFDASLLDPRPLKVQLRHFRGELGVEVSRVKKCALILAT